MSNIHICRASMAMQMALVCNGLQAMADRH